MLTYKEINWYYKVIIVEHENKFHELPIFNIKESDYVMKANFNFNGKKYLYHSYLELINNRTTLVTELLEV